MKIKMLCCAATKDKVRLAQVNNPNNMVSIKELVLSPANGWAFNHAGQFKEGEIYEIDMTVNKCSMMERPKVASSIC